MTMTTERHKHADAIIAWANGKDIQFKSRAAVMNGDPWKDLGWPRKSSVPPFYPDWEYRVKPEPKKIKYRVALFRYKIDGYWTKSYNNHESAVEATVSSCFVRWLTDWVEEELPED